MSTEEKPSLSVRSLSESRANIRLQQPRRTQLASGMLAFYLTPRHAIDSQSRRSMDRITKSKLSAIYSSQVCSTLVAIHSKLAISAVVGKQTDIHPETGDGQPFRVQFSLRKPYYWEKSRQKPTDICEMVLFDFDLIFSLQHTLILYKVGGILFQGVPK